MTACNPATSLRQKMRLWQICAGQARGVRPRRQAHARAYEFVGRRRPIRRPPQARGSPNGCGCGSARPLAHFFPQRGGGVAAFSNSWEQNPPFFGVMMCANADNISQAVTALLNKSMVVPHTTHVTTPDSGCYFDISARTQLFYLATPQHYTHQCRY